MQAPNTTGTSQPENLLLMDRVVDEIVGFPGVRMAAHASRAPFEPTTLTQRTLRVEGMAEDGIVSPMGQVNAVSPDYFETVGIAVTSGRPFTAADDGDAEDVAIINTSMARDLFGEADPINARMSQQQNNGMPLSDSLRCLLLQEMVMNKMLVEQAERDSLLVSEDEVEGTLDNRIRYFIRLYG